MDIYLTADYEIYFGQPQGTVEKCLLYPTELLIEICQKHRIATTQFIDIGYIIQLKENEQSFPELKKQRIAITEQIKKLVKLGHSCQLHIHPHWEKSIYKDGAWIIDTNFYKLNDFSEKKAEEITRKYFSELEQITQSSIQSFRAGGWCVQPFSYLDSVFQELGIQNDSSVFRGGKNLQAPYFYDFSKAPDKSKWKFSVDPALEKENGNFTEIPITSAKYSPLFFWQLYIMGRLNPKNHKPLGDGYPISSKGNNKWNSLTQTQHLYASMDGYFAKALPRILNSISKKEFNEMVVIGHPKAYTHYSLKKLEAFIDQNKEKHRFKTM